MNIFNKVCFINSFEDHNWSAQSIFFSPFNMKQYVNTTQLQNTVLINTLHVDNFHVFNTNDFFGFKSGKNMYGLPSRNQFPWR